MIFGDAMFTGDVEAISGQVHRLYQTSFNRDPNASGFEFWGTGATDLASVATAFSNSAEFAAVYGGGSTEDFVRALYQNALGREAEANGLTYWTDRIDGGGSVAGVLLGFSQSAELRASSATDVTAWVEAQGTHDVLAGNGGANTLSGGLFSDTFVFGTDANSSHDVTDLESWDMLDFSAFGYGDVNAAIAQMSQQGDDVVFVDQDVMVTLQDTMLNEVAPDMIMV